MKCASVMVRALLCVLICGANSTAVGLTLQHNQNFGSGLILTCFEGVFRITSGVTYQRNGVDLGLEVNSDGALGYPLTQEREGEFTCTHDGHPSQAITLAAVPPLGFPTQRSHRVFVPTSGTVSTQLSCDIRPGAARESYSLQWFRLNSDDSFISITEGTNEEFSLTIPVSLNSNNAVYLCTVTIDHDGSGNGIPYNGARITISTTELKIQHNHDFGSGLVLTCSDGLFPIQGGVTFWRNNVSISDHPDHDGRVNYPLTQNGEGEFTCTRTDNGQTVRSKAITLAAVPSLDFPLHRLHYVLVPRSGTVLTELTCDIGPGLARESYSLLWRQLNSDNSFTTISDGLNHETFTLTVPMTATTSNVMYRCTVYIDHDGTGNYRSVYDGATITVKTAVYASISEDVQGKVVTVGEPANFSCSATGSEVNIEWIIDGEVYDSCPQGGTAICSEITYVNETEIRSTLIIPTTTDLGVGVHQVKCVVRQNLIELFVEEFEESTNAALRIYPYSPTITAPPTNRVLLTEENVVSFTCEALGSPGTVIQWYHNQNLVLLSPNYAINSTSLGAGVIHSELTIMDESSLTNGEVKCEAITSYEDESGLIGNLTSSASAVFTVLDVIISDPPQNKSASVGERVSFSCTAVSFLFQPEVDWMVDNETYASCSSEALCHNDILNKQTTRGVLTITASEEAKRAVTCVVRQQPDVRKTAFLIVQATDENALSTGPVVGAVLSSLLLLLLLISLFALMTCRWYIKRRDQFKNRQGYGEQAVEIHLQEHGERNDRDYGKLENKVIPRNSIRILNFIGEGEFGVVYKAHFVRASSENPLHATVATLTVAVKTLKGFHDQERADALLDEATKMKDLDHPNVLNLIGVCVDGGSSPHIVMPYMANGSLLAHLRSDGNVFVLVNCRQQALIRDTSRRLLAWCLQVAQGMEYLAANEIVHKDLATRNCMLGENMVIKIADFGFSEKMYTKAYVRMVVDGLVKLPVKWMAPESICYGVFSEKSDVWSFGVTCWEIFTGGVTPYPGVHPSAIPRMRNHERMMDRPDNQACSEDMYGVMLDCWEGDPDDRPSFSQLVTVLTAQLETLAGGYLEIRR